MTSPATNRLSCFIIHGSGPFPAEYNIASPIQARKITSPNTKKLNRLLFFKITAVRDITHPLHDRKRAQYESDLAPQEPPLAMTSLRARSPPPSHISDY